MSRITVAASRALAALPLPVLRALAAWAGERAWRHGGSRRRVAECNIAACFPDLHDAEQAALVRATWRATAMGLAETLAAYWQGPDRIRGQVTVEGLEHVKAAAARGGVLLLTGHSTTVELGVRALCEALERRPAQVAREPADQVVADAVRKARLRYSAAVIAKKGTRALLRALRNGGMVIYAPDQNFTYHEVFTTFFGVPAATTTATAEIVARTAASVVPFWCVRDSGGYRVCIEQAWSDYPSGDKEADARRINAWLEHKIAQAPEQYLWVHRRFRHQPEGAPPFYPDEALRVKHRQDDSAE